MLQYTPYPILERSINFAKENKLKLGLVSQKEITNVIIDRLGWISDNKSSDLNNEVKSG